MATKNSFNFTANVLLQQRPSERELVSEDGKKERGVTDQPC